MNSEPPVPGAEIVHRAYDAWHRSDVDAFVALHDPTCEISPLIVSVEGGGPYRGHGGIRKFWEDIHAAFEEWLPTPEDVRDFGGGEMLVARIRFRGRGRDSGIEIDRMVWQALRLRDGRAVWWAMYPTEAEAVEAIQAAQRSTDSAR